MSVTLLKQKLTTRGLPTDGLKPALVEQLTQAPESWVSSEGKLGSALPA